MLVDQRVPMFGNVGGKDANLAIINLSNGSTVLSGDADRILTFFDEAAFSEDQGTIRTAEIRALNLFHVEHLFPDGDSFFQILIFHFFGNQFQEVGDFDMLGTFLQTFFTANALGRIGRDSAECASHA